MSELLDLIEQVRDTCRRTIALYDIDASAVRASGVATHAHVARHNLGSVETGLNAIRRAARDAAEAPAVPVGHVHVDVVHGIASEYLAQLAAHYAVARGVNRTLGGRSDPIGVAAWWTQSNGYLPDGAAPCTLLADVDSHQILRDLAHGATEIGG